MRGGPDRSSDNERWAGSKRQRLAGSAWGQQLGHVGQGHASQRRCWGVRGRSVGGASGVGRTVGWLGWTIGPR
jgi:hypothetical protein